MTHTVQHGRKHEIEFYSEPDGNTFLAGVAEVLRGPGIPWGQADISFRCISISPDRCTYIIEETDIWQALFEKNPTHSKDTKVVEINLTCDTCSTKYNVWKIVGDDWRSDKYWLYTNHCPACPPISPDVWLAQLGYYPERPTLVSVNVSDSAQPRPADVDMADFD